ncbi:Cro/Cl family transcriptional regulator [Pseudomonas sp. SDI]|uniref:LexA family protein n=1 Tax=Pseudomonas sp. SDI TaxID=2170734 RepID=UPI000DE73CCA|nr:S24 family peptidase [Pseudomonas sp. SDI]PWB32408.1 Cro/Cl family transcriptional regulator [Pseudomonas sp. SDI]
MDKWITLVKSRMRELKLTQEKLAERMGVTQGAVGHWLRKEREPTLDRMNEILVVLGLGHLQMNASTDVAEPMAQYAAQEGQAVYRYPLRAWNDLTLDQAHTELCDYAAHGTAYWLSVEGDAMTAPLGLSVPAGMLVLVDCGQDAEPGKLVLARLQADAQPLFRQLIEEGGQRYLRPLNPTYPKLLWSDEGEVLGVVVRAMAKFA